MYTHNLILHGFQMDALLTANYENRLCQNFIRTVLTEGI